jgi:hypothetical protein
LDFYPINEKFRATSLQELKKRNRLGWRHQRIENHSMWNMEKWYSPSTEYTIKTKYLQEYWTFKTEKIQNYLFCPFQILLGEWKLYWRKVYWFDYAKREYYCYRFQ